MLAILFVYDIINKRSDRMKEKIAKLIDLKSIVTIIITGALIYGFVVDKINAEQFMTIATMIFTFYFASKTKGSDNNE